MLGWLRKAFGPQSEPLTGAPLVRRQKTYSAESGYVYQYHYEGSRPAGEGREYVFMVTSGRGGGFPVSVTLFESALEPWQTEHGRVLVAQERFAVAKMSMKQAFDERESPQRMRDPVHPSSNDVREILAMLGVE